jgi:formyltetrahydrofolate hydrolase
MKSTQLYHLICNFFYNIVRYECLSRRASGDELNRISFKIDTSYLHISTLLLELESLPKTTETVVLICTASELKKVAINLMMDVTRHVMDEVLMKRLTTEIVDNLMNKLCKI